MSYIPEAELVLYEDGGVSSLLVAELKNLRFKRTQKGIAFVTDRHGEVKTDDCADALAGACAAANDGIKMSLPDTVLVNTGFR